ncbi:MAG: hypothetical protein LKI28_05785 [Ancrocorticia sp.]|jgi:hypothetical protein|nr:hypothetical protein [Ancrocorticia sp.]
MELSALGFFAGIHSATVQSTSTPNDLNSHDMMNPFGPRTLVMLALHATLPWGPDTIVPAKDCVRCLHRGFQQYSREARGPVVVDSSPAIDGISLALTVSIVTAVVPTK